MTSIPDQTVRAWADVSLGALVANARTVAAVSGARLLPMVKANGYGVGAVAVARALEGVDPWGYGVATVEEGAELRAAGISRPILVFSPLAPLLVRHHLRHELTPVIGDRDALEAWCAAGVAPFHVEIDTGMSRTGVRWDEAPAWSDSLAAASGWEGVFTHFHSAEEDPGSVAPQWERFLALLARLPVRPPLVHAANSAVALRGRTYAADLVRPGIFLYGGTAAEHRPEPVVRLQAQVVATRTLRRGESVSYGATWRATRDTRVATLGLGYADGVLRSLGNKGLVELGGRVVPILGRVTMDFVMVEAADAVSVGDVAVVFGGLVSLDEQARRAGTISYELLTAMGPRVRRRYQ
jgi:alanine racemase